MTSQSHNDWIGRAIGMVVFVLGVGLLVFVFFMAYRLFNATPTEALGLVFTGNSKTDPTASTIGTNFGWMLIRVGYLFLMAISGSLIAQKGINLYFSAIKGSPVSITAHAPASTSPAPPAA